MTDQDRWVMSQYPNGLRPLVEFAPISRFDIGGNSAGHRNGDILQREFVQRGLFPKT